MFLHRVIKVFYNEIIRKYSIVKRYVFFFFFTVENRNGGKKKFEPSLSIHDIPTTSGRVSQSKSTTRTITFTMTSRRPLMFLLVWSTSKPRITGWGRKEISASRFPRGISRFTREKSVLRPREISIRLTLYPSPPSLFPWKNTI